MHFQHFYQSDATYVRTLILKDRKKCKKVDSKSIVNRPIQFPNKHRACFFRILKNRCVKRPTLLSMCPPPYSAFAKSDYNPHNNNKQHERQILQSVLECAYGRNKRFAQKFQQFLVLCQFTLGFSEFLPYSSPSLDGTKRQIALYRCIMIYTFILEWFQNDLRQL